MPFFTVISTMLFWDKDNGTNVGIKQEFREFLDTFEICKPRYSHQLLVENHHTTPLCLHFSIQN